MEGTNDALTLALGTPEHRGCVRGVGVGVTPIGYLYTPTPCRQPKQVGRQKELDDLQKQ